MSRENEGIVLELRGEYALVMPTGHTGCEQAQCCQGSGVNKVNVEMINTISAKTGDKVVFIAKESNMLWAAFIVYVLPLLLTVIGAVAGYNLAPYIGLGSNLVSTIAGILFFILGVAIIKGYDRFASTNRAMKPEIIRFV